MTTKYTPRRFKRSALLLAAKKAIEAELADAREDVEPGEYTINDKTLGFIVDVSGVLRVSEDSPASSAPSIYTREVVEYLLGLILGRSFALAEEEDLFRTVADIVEDTHGDDERDEIERARAGKYVDRIRGYLTEVERLRKGQVRFNGTAKAKQIKGVPA